MPCQFMVRRLALGSPYSKPSTAEDGLPSGQPMSPSRTSQRQYSRGPRPTQRNRQNLFHPAVDSAAPWPPRQPAQGPELSAKHNTGGSNAHTALRAAVKEEAGTSPLPREAGTDRLLSSHIPGNGIRQKARPNSRDAFPIKTIPTLTRIQSCSRELQVNSRLSALLALVNGSPKGCAATCKPASRHVKVRRLC
jgi:hypothetical protein